MAGLGGLVLDRKKGIPLYLQVINEIEQQLRTGRLVPGERLPPERELALELGVSRNTVSLAYRWLEQEGWLSSRQGRGTFVSPLLEMSQPASARSRLVNLLDRALQEALAAGLSLQEFLTLAQEVVMEKDRQLGTVNVVFVECNREQLDYFARELQLGAGVTIVPLLLEELVRDPGLARQALEQADLVVTTFFHLDEVNALLPPGSKPALGIALDPLLETVVRMARLPQGTRVGLVCLSRAFGERVQRSMENAGIQLDVDVITSRDRAELARFVAGREVIVASPGRRREVEQIKGAGATVIEFVYRPDAGSINTLKAAVLDTRRKRQQRSDPVVSG
ncbi:MAG: GntR family transcriptional regulator [Bacillota bacterium]